MRGIAYRPVTTAVLTLCLAASFAVDTAQAHAKLVSSDPAMNSTVAAPKLIHLQFSEEIATKFSSFEVTDTDGNAVAMMTMPSPDAKTLEAMPKMPLSPGLYTVTWTSVATDDGHKMSGSYSFTVK